MDPSDIGVPDDRVTVVNVREVTGRGSCSSRRSRA